MHHLSAMHKGWPTTLPPDFTLSVHQTLAHTHSHFFETHLQGSELTLVSGNGFHCFIILTDESAGPEIHTTQSSRASERHTHGNTYRT